jgi:hypothetical protein
MVPSSEWADLWSVCVSALLTMISPHSVTITSISALRMYRGLIDSAAINCPLNGLVGATRPSAIRFTHSNLRDEYTICNMGGAVTDRCPPTRASPGGILRIKRQDDDEPFNRETV